jgi:hypothetical protein
MEQSVLGILDFLDDMLSPSEQAGHRERHMHLFFFCAGKAHR